MHNELRLATSDLAEFLQRELPELSNDWWKHYVVERLSFQQQRIIEEKHAKSLRELDLAALLRVLDHNWFELSIKLKFPREGRNWVKELQTVRNKWAHASADEAHPSELYRDADTLERLMSLIGGSKASVEAARAAKNAALASMAIHTKSDTEGAPKNDNTAEKVIPTGPMHLFQVGDLVTLRSDNSFMMPVLEVVLGGPEVRYRVFRDGAKATYYESQLQAVKSQGDDKPEISIEEFKARLTALHLLSPSTANLFSLRSGRVNFVPYQYRPVLKLIKSDRPRLLIADEVGVGKTIEAGLVIKELRARMDISSILVICPKALVAERKWQTEMKRFDEEFTHIDGKLLRHCLQEIDLEGEWPQKYEKAILPFSLFDSELILGRCDQKKKQDRGLLALDPAPEFDLVIVDEAHHLRNPETFLHQGVRYFCDNAKAVLLMTATPVQLGSSDLFTLLNIVRPDLVIDETSFQQMAKPNGYINEAIRLCRERSNGWQKEAVNQLREAAQTEWGRLFLREETGFQEAYDKLQEADISDNERVLLTRKLEELYTFSSIINRTRRRDIGEFTTRKPQTLTVDFTDEQRDLHDKLLDIITRILARCHGQQNVKFMMTTIRRQAASCLYGLSPLLSDILARKLSQLEVIESNDINDEIDLSFLDEVRAEIEDLLVKAKNLDPEDAKVAAFIRTLKDKTVLENNKALVFSTFRHTLAYLAKHSEAAGLRFGLVHGDVRDEDRAELRRRFALPREDDDALDVLLSSEVGCEGLDFQFCDFLVNYDLPWNPMRIEQRIGRIDRYGQKSDAVSIVNFITPGTVDADIYQRCLWRIGVFHHAVGGSEEILGEITQEIHDIAESFVLSDDEREKKLQQLADNSIRRVREEQELEERESELFGLNVPKQSWREDIENAENEWLSATSIRRCVSKYLQSKTGLDTDPLSGDKQLKTLRISQEARNTLLSDFRKLKKSNDALSKNWEKWLKGGSPSLTVTFDQDIASENPSAVHLTVLHPLVRQAAYFFEMDEAMYCSLEVSEGLPPGEHRFALYRWTKHGIKPDEQLVAVASNPEVEAALLNVLSKAVEPIISVSQSAQDLDELDSLHHSKWSAAQADHIAENQTLAEHRVQSLLVSHLARVRTLEDQLEKATNERIRRMKEAELARANADFERRVNELRDAGNTGDIRAEPIMLGVISVRSDG